MKKLRYILFMAVTTGVLFSCGTEPDPIKYGEDSCHYCNMTIVSQSYAALALSEKGKQFNYDAIECMVHDNIQNDTEMAMQQVADYENPGQMLKVTEADFVINDSINSPMGANLAAVEKSNHAVSGTTDTFTWQELKEHFVNQSSLTIN